MRDAFSERAGDIGDGYIDVGVGNVDLEFE